MHDQRAELERVSKIEDPLLQAKEALIVCNAMIANSEERIVYHTKMIDKIFGQDKETKSEALAILDEYKVILEEERKEREKIIEFIREQEELIQ